jgi:hypothetical protein
MKKFFSVIWKYRLPILGGIILWLIFAIYRPFEPHYHGKPLSAWATDVYSSSKRDAAIVAIQRMGTNALPCAIKFCCTENIPIKNRFLEWASAHQPGETTYDQFILSCGKLVEPATTTQSKGIAVFEALGTTARPAIPDLIKLLENTNFGVADTASESLTYIGYDAIPPLIDALTNQNQGAQFCAIRSLKYLYLTDTAGDFETSIRPAIPILVVRLADKNPYMRRLAATALAKFQVGAPIVVPALIEALKRETNFDHQTFGSHLSLDFYLDSLNFLYALSSFHTNAQPAIPILTNLIKNDSQLGFHSLETLWQIAPEKAEVFIQKFNVALTNPPPDDLVSNVFYNYHGTGNPEDVNDINAERLPDAFPSMQIKKSLLRRQLDQTGH